MDTDKRMDFHNRRGVYLKKLKPLSKLKNRGFATFDVETKDGLKGCKVFCWSLAFKGKDRKIHTLQRRSDELPKNEENLYSALFEKIDNSKDKSHKRIIYVHNLGFDIRFIIDYCVRHEIEYNALTSGSAVIGLTIDSIGVCFRDSYQFLLSSQEKAEIDWNVNEEFRKINCNKIFNKNFALWSRKEKKRVFDHNANDVIALYEIMENFRKTMFEIAHLDSLTVHSLASLAMKAYKIFMPYDLPNPFVYLEFNKEKNHMSYAYEKKEAAFVRRSYFGGRTEVFNQNKQKNAVYIDRVSMFPAEMKFNKYPVGWGRWIRDSEILSNSIQGLNNLEGFIECYVIPNAETTNYPVLPLRMDKKIMYTNCKRTHVYALPELKYAHEMGYQIYPIKGFMFDESDYIFDKFVSVFFKLKSESEGGKRQCAKILLNSCYGKFGQKYERTAPLMHYFKTKMEMLEYKALREDMKKFKMSYSSESKLYIIVEIVPNTTIKPFMNVCIGSYVTSYSRVRLIKKIHEFEQKEIPVYYADTDSTTIDNANLVDMKLGKELGAWDIEQKFEEVRFLSPKCYISTKYVKNKKTNEMELTPFLKMKGIDKSKIREICRETIKAYKKDGINMMDTIEELIRKPIQLAERYMTYNEAHRRGVILGTKERSKHYSHINNKRNFKNGVSIPWNDATLPLKFRKKVKAKC